MTTHLNRAFAGAPLLALCLGQTSTAASLPLDLGNYYVHLQPASPPLPVGWFDEASIKVATPPLVTGAIGPVGNGLPIDLVVLQRSYPAANARIGILGYHQADYYRPCRTFDTFAAIPQAVFAGQKVLDQAIWYYPWSAFCGESFGAGPQASAILPTTDQITFGTPIRRIARDGGQYDASPMVIERNGLPWASYHWGYRLGMVASVSDWNAQNPAIPANLANWPAVPGSRDNFELVALPPPWVEDDVVEYVNKLDFPKQPGGQFFYAVRAEDKTVLDSIPAWQRSGKGFKSGGYVSACRFYGGKNGGPNTHFYSADDKECAALKAIPALSYEGQTFAVNMPMPGSNADGSKPCPQASKPLFRLYNNASAPGKDYVSNHRYVTERADVGAATAQGWVDEGQVMCVPL